MILQEQAMRCAALGWKRKNRNLDEWMSEAIDLLPSKDRTHSDIAKVNEAVLTFANFISQGDLSVHAVDAICSIVLGWE